MLLRISNEPASCVTTGAGFFNAEKKTASPKAAVYLSVIVERIDHWIT
jgi:hypothetical protein